jgi:hypothetical protein
MTPRAPLSASTPKHPSLEPSRGNVRTSAEQSLGTLTASSTAKARLAHIGGSRLSCTAAMSRRCETQWLLAWRICVFEGHETEGVR